MVKEVTVESPFGMMISVFHGIAEAGRMSVAVRLQANNSNSEPLDVVLLMARS
jgi:hypothetical protein